MARDSDLNQIENAFKVPEDGFWEKNSLEGIVGNSELFRIRNSRPPATILTHAIACSYMPALLLRKKILPFSK